VTDLTPAPAVAGATLLACIYYKVPAADLESAISMVREFQRTLPALAGAAGAQVLLRCALPRDDASSTRSNASEPPTEHAPPAAPPSGAAVAQDVEHTLMETYTLPLPANPAAASAATAAFLAALDRAAAPLAAIVRGARHTELFRPCAS
jgi:hypothetical protein